MFETCRPPGAAAIEHGGGRLVVLGADLEVGKGPQPFAEQDGSRLLLPRRARRRLRARPGLVWSDIWRLRQLIISTITEAKANLSALIERVERGEEIIIGRAGKPVAVLKAYDHARRQRQPGSLRGRIEIADDFDELPADVAAAFGMLDDPS